MESGGVRKSPTIAIMAASALVISVWGVIAQNGAGAADDHTLVYGDKSDCPQQAQGPCLSLANNSVGLSEIQKNAVGADEIVKNAIRSNELLNGGVKGIDVGTLGLRNVKGVFPGVVATGSATLANSSNDYFGSAGVPNGPAHFHNFDTVSTQGAGNWNPCRTDPTQPPQFPCLRVPSTGTYQVTVKGLWEENTTGGRQISLFEVGTACDFASSEWVTISQMQAADLPQAQQGGRLQVSTVLAPLEKDQCLVAQAWNNDSLTDLDLDIEVSLVLQ